MDLSLQGISKLLQDIEARQEKRKQKEYNKKIGYAPKCSICNDPQLDEIEKLREDGYTLQEIKDNLQLGCSIMALSRHFKNHYPQSQAYKQKQQIQALKNMQEAYTKYPFLEDYFKNKELGYLEEFNTEYGFCTDRFGLCSHLPASTVSNGYKNIHRLYNEQDQEIQRHKENSFSFYDDNETTAIRLRYNNVINICLNCKNQIQEERLTLLEKIITYNFLNIAPENKELYFNLLEFDGNPEEFIQTLTEAKEETQQGT